MKLFPIARPNQGSSGCANEKAVGQVEGSGRSKAQAGLLGSFQEVLVGGLLPCSWFSS